MASKKAIFLLEQSRGASYLARAAKRLVNRIINLINFPCEARFLSATVLYLNAFAASNKCWVLPLQNQVDKRCNISDADLAVTIHIGRA